jgi:hypothetical protein
MQKKSIHFFILFIISLFLFSSTHVEAHSVSKAKKQYKKVLKKWTKGDKTYQNRNFLATIHWKATLLSDDMLKAQNDLLSHIYEYSENEKSRKYFEVKNQIDGYTVFFVSFYSGNKRYNDLKNKKAGWEIYLETKNFQIPVSKIEKISKYPTPQEKLLYPYLDSWFKGYYLWFKTDQAIDSKEIKLKINSPNARSTLIWP